MSSIILEYLKVFFSWPPLIGLVLLYFVITQRSAISRLIDRIRQVSFPGGSVDTEYSGLPKEKVDQIPIPIKDTEIRAESKDAIEKRIIELDKAFDRHLFLDMSSNKTIITSLMDVVWKKSLAGLFGDKVPIKFLEKVQVLANRLNSRAIEDLKYLDKVTTDPNPSRESILEAYIKSKLLVDFFRGLATQ